MVIQFLLVDPESWETLPVTSTISLILLSVIVISEPFNSDKGSVLVLLIIKLYSASKRGFEIYLPKLRFILFQNLAASPNAALNNLLKTIGMHLPNCNTFDRWVSNIFTLANETFAKALRILKTLVSVNNKLCGKFV